MSTAGSPAVVQIPLSEAVIEVRFPGDVRVETFRGEFQQAIRAEFPALRVPRISSGDAVATQPYMFTDADQTRALMLAVNLFAYSSRDYAGWALFSQRFLSYWGPLGERLAPETFTRVSVRYINRFEPDMKVYVQVDGLPLLSPLAVRPAAHRSATRFETVNGNMITAQVELGDAQSTLVVDLDVFTEDVQVADLPTVLEALHADAEALFVSVISPDYAKMLDLGR